jgi:hypothetical protein
MTLIAQMAQRYPSQDLTDSLEGYLADYEQLTLKYSLPKVQAALAALRIDPKQAFFPRPDEVAAQIEAAENARAAEYQRRATQRMLDNLQEQFWEWVDFQLTLPEWQGKSEQELLDSIKAPGYTGLKARGVR